MADSSERAAQLAQERAIGVLQGAVDGLQRSISALMSTWQTQDNLATEGRRKLYEKVDGLATTVNAFSGDLASLKKDIETVKPIVRAGELEYLRGQGTWRLLKLLGQVLYGLGLALVGVIVERYRSTPH